MTYRFHQLINATLSPAKALEVHEPSPAMLGGIHMEALVAERLGFTPWLPDGVEFTDAERELYDVPAQRAVEVLKDDVGLLYQPALCWPWQPGTIVDVPEAEGHPDFILFDEDHIIDLKTTEYPSDDLLQKLLRSVQMACYMAAYKRQYDRDPMLSIILASRLVAPHPVAFNKNGDVSLSGQKADYAALQEAVTLMGDRADDRHFALVYKAPVWNPILVDSLPKEKCAELAKVGEIFLDAGLAILNTGLAESVVRPYA